MNCSNYKSQLLLRNFFSGFLATGLFISLPAFALAASGDIDLTFGSGGIVVTSFTNQPYRDEPRSIQLQPDGKIVVCGEVIEDTEESFFTASFFLARYHPTGELDTSFGTNGKVVAPINSGEELVGIKIALQPDGKIIAVGYRFINFSAHFAVNRYNSDGTLDASFGTGGKVVTEIGGNTRQSANSVTVQPDGKIVVVGGASYDSGFVVVRYNSNGSLDTRFGEGGKSINVINNSGYNSGSASAVMLQPDGKIVAAGRYLYHNSYNNTTVGIALIRYNANGSIDSGFGPNGIVLHPLNYGAYLTDAVLQPDGGIVVSVFAASDSPNFYRARLIVRYNANGSLDTGFAANGIFTAPDIFSSSNYVAGDIALEPNGRIVTFGNSNGGIAALRLNPNGSADTAFGTNGIATATFGSQSSYGWKGSIQPDGRILLLGQAVTSSPDSYSADIGVARLLGDSAVLASTKFDFDGDGRSDISAFRPSDSMWYLNRSTDGFAATQFGLSTDKITPADFDGDGRTDIAVFRDGLWFWLNSSDGILRQAGWGTAGDAPQPADYTGDGRADLAVYRGGTWFIYDNATGSARSEQFGISTDRPVAADYDGDGRTDLAVYRDGIWHLNRSSGGFAAVHFGLSTDRPVAGDYDGDGKADLVVYRDGTWYLLQSTAGFTAFQWGLSTDIPAPADYDGDGRSDAAVFRNGTWYLRQSTSGFAARQFGLAADQPVPAAYLP